MIQTPIASAPRVISAARSWLGTPYHHGQSAKHIGTDCLGLIRGLYRELIGVEPAQPPPYSRDWAEAARVETLLMAANAHLLALVSNDLSPGLVLAFRWRNGTPAKHLAVVAQSELAPTLTMIHAIEDHGVIETPITPWWQRRIAARYAFPDPHTESHY